MSDTSDPLADVLTDGSKQSPRESEQGGVSRHAGSDGRRRHGVVPRPTLTDDEEKITLRADDDLIDQLEAFDASKSEVMREALREYLETRLRASDPPSSASESVTDAETIDELIEERVDSIIADRLQRDTTTRSHRMST